ncbi:MAG: signal peptidase II [Bacillaceae bacterium]
MQYYLLALIVILVDQFTKWIIVKTMALGESIEIIPSIFYITSHRNTGAAWGILAGKMVFFYIITILFVAGIVYYIRKHGIPDVLTGIGLSLVLGGAIGNFIDRFFRKEVVDFFHVYIGDYSFPIFNVADMALCIGVGFILLQTVIEIIREKNMKEQ